MFKLCSNYQIIEILEIYFGNMNCFPWIKLISVLIHLKNWYYNTPSLQLHYLPRHLCRISPWPTGIHLHRNLHHVLHRFPYFSLTHSTAHHNYWIYQTICQAKLIKLIIKLYTDHNTLLVKYATYQKLSF